MQGTTDETPRSESDQRHTSSVSLWFVQAVSQHVERSRSPGVSSIFSSEPSDLAQQSPVDPTVAQVRAEVFWPDCQFFFETLI